MKYLTLLALLLVLVFAFAQTDVDLLSEDVEEVETLETEIQASHTESLGDIAQCQKIYGSYCGPGYCAGAWWGKCGGGGRKDISQCNTAPAGVDALDNCCRTHDKCCVDSRKSGAPKGMACQCDAALVQCSSGAKCKLTKPTCFGAKALITTFFKARLKVSDKCC